MPPQCLLIHNSAKGSLGFVRLSLLLLQSDFAACEKFDHALVKGGQVFGTAAADPGAIAHHFLVNPVAACVADIVLDGVVAGQRFAFDKASGDQQPGAMTDHSNRFALFVSLADELLSHWFHS